MLYLSNKTKNQKGKHNRLWPILLFVSLLCGIIVSYHVEILADIASWLKYVLRIGLSALIVFICFYNCSFILNRFSASFATIYTAIMIGGRVFTEHRTLFPLLTRREVILLVLQSLSFFVIFVSLFSVVRVYMLNLSICVKKEPLKEKTAKSSLIWLFSFLATVAFYALWLFLLRPNIATYDSANQIAQAFRWIPLENNNPFLHTLMMRCVLLLAFDVTGGVLSAITVYEVFSILVFSAITATLIAYYENTYSKKSIFVRLLELFYFINPLIGWYAATLWKDIWISYFIVLFALNCRTVLLQRGGKKGSLVWVSLSALLVLFSKGTGILYIGLVLLAVSAEIQGKLQKKIILSLLFSMLVYIGVTGIATTYLNVGKHMWGDTSSAVWQTLARTSKYHLNELSEKDKEAINPFFDLEHAGEVYDPKISDPVKNTCVDFQSIAANKGAFVAAWVRIGLKHPGTYINALFASGYGYYYPEIRYDVFSTTNYVTTLQNPLFRDILRDPYIDKYDTAYAFARKAEVDALEIILDNLRTWPGFGLYASIGTYYMLYFMLITIGSELRIGFQKILASLPVGVLIACVLSPVYAEMRYAYPAVLSLPMFFSFYAEAIANHNSEHITVL